MTAIVKYQINKSKNKISKNKKIKNKKKEFEIKTQSKIKLNLKK